MSLLNKEEEIFRLPAVLYKDGNYEVSTENTLKKIVKAIFFGRKVTGIYTEKFQTIYWV